MRRCATFTLIGQVRGSCGHKHLTFEDAARCEHDDEVGCEMQGGYSDRVLYAVEDGETRRLTSEEYEPWFAALVKDRGRMRGH